MQIKLYVYKGTWYSQRLGKWVLNSVLKKKEGKGIIRKRIADMVMETDEYW